MIKLCTRSSVNSFISRRTGDTVLTAIVMKAYSSFTTCVNLALLTDLISDHTPLLISLILFSSSNARLRFAVVVALLKLFLIKFSSSNSEAFKILLISIRIDPAPRSKNIWCLTRASNKNSLEVIGLGIGFSAIWY